jgi:hypothetical protein
MLFSIIHTVDCHGGVNIGYYLPRRSLMRQLRITEDDAEYEYDYLEGSWEKGHHRKLVGVLTRPQFEAFMEDTGIWAFDEECEVIGSPACWWGVAPAMVFRTEDPNTVVSCAVTPLPEVVGSPAPYDEKVWDRTKKAVLALYGDAYRLKYTTWGSEYTKACRDAYHHTRRLCAQQSEDR